MILYCSFRGTLGITFAMVAMSVAMQVALVIAWSAVAVKGALQGAVLGGPRYSHGNCSLWVLLWVQG